MSLFILCSAVSVTLLQALNDSYEAGFRQSFTALIRSGPQYYVDNSRTAASVQEVRTRVSDPDGPAAFMQKVSYATPEKTDLTGTVPEEESGPDAGLLFDQDMTPVHNEYYVQVGSLKNYKHAENMSAELKQYYPDVRIVEQNNFYKVRITGIQGKHQGAMISGDIEKQLNMKPLLVKKTVNASLDDAVKPFIGTSYSKIDCYGLIVRGLINQGVKYYGLGGLREKLENQAEIDGLPNNTYFSGEGLVEKAGEKLFSKFLPSISDTRENADYVYSEIAPYLQKGFVLSFSTPTRGHTGVVSRKGGEWTYINSGIIDNQVYPGTVSKRVGEEFLQAEIENWFAFASRRKEPLTVTLGRLDISQLRNSSGPDKYEGTAASNIY